MEPLRAAAPHPHGVIDFGAPPPGALTWSPVHAEEVPEDRIVRAAFRALVGQSGLSAPQARSLGRAMGSEVLRGDIRAYLDAFSHLGLGALTLASSEKGRVVVTGHALEGSGRPGAPACALVLGFVEGALGAIERTPALGAETSCRSRGHATCSFFVRSRP